MDLKHFLFSFEGRIDAVSYWAFVLSAIVANLVVSLIVALIFGTGSAAHEAWRVLSTILLIWPGLAVQIKRWHDRNKSGVWVLIQLIPIIGPVWAFIELGFLRGTEGTNRYGPDPRQADWSSSETPTNEFGP